LAEDDLEKVESSGGKYEAWERRSKVAIKHFYFQKKSRWNFCGHRIHFLSRLLMQTAVQLLLFIIRRQKSNRTLIHRKSI
jgi:hypothetical protein